MREKRREKKNYYVEIVCTTCLFIWFFGSEDVHNFLSISSLLSPCSEIISVADFLPIHMHNEQYNAMRLWCDRWATASQAYIVSYSIL